MHAVSQAIKKGHTMEKNNQNDMTQQDEIETSGKSIDFT